MLLGRKLARDLLGQKGQAIAVLVVSLLGAMLFVSSAGAYQDLRDSYSHTRSRLRLADLHVDATDLNDADVARVRALPGVREVDTRVVASIPVGIVRDGSLTRVEVRVLSLPERGGQPALDRILVTWGQLPSAPDEILLEKHLAEHHHLRPGSVILLDLSGVVQRLTVTGIGVSAEYLWVSRDAQDPMPSANAFGVGWMRRDALRRVALEEVPSRTDRPVALPGLETARGDSANQLLVALEPGAATGDVVARIRRTLGGARMIAATPASQLVGPRLLQMDVDGYKGMAAFFPVFFLGVAAFILATIVGRFVDAQRAVIGTFSALGVGRGTLLFHYLGYALILGGVGSVSGSICGLIITPMMTRSYARELSIPFVSAGFHWKLALVGSLLGTAVALLAGAIPAYKASRLAPAEAMRPPRPHAGRLTAIARRVRMPLPMSMAARDVLDRPLRSLGTALGVSAALVLVLATGSMLDSMRTTIRVLFSDAQRFDFRVDLVAPAEQSAIEADMRRLSGVRDVETVLSLPVALSARGRAEDVLLQGILPDARLLRSVDLDGRLVPPSEGGVVITRSIARTLGVNSGDTISIRILPSGPWARFRVSGFADGTMGRVATVRRLDAQRAFGLDGLVTSAVMTGERSQLTRIRSALADRTGVAHLQDLAGLRAQTDELMGLGWVMLGLMLAFGVVLAAAILYNTATLGILERRRDLATLRAMGWTMREIALWLTLEHAMLALLGLLIGIPLAIAASRRVLASYSSDLFAFPLVLSGGTLAFGIFGVLLVLFLAQWPALRHVARDSLAGAVRSREG